MLVVLSSPVPKCLSRDVWREEHAATHGHGSRLAAWQVSRVEVARGTIELGSLV